MRKRVPLIATFLSLTIAYTGLFFVACNEEKSSEDAATATEATSPADITQPFTLAIVAGTLDVPKGAFAEGTTLTFKQTEPPSQFASASSESSSSSDAVLVEASDANGAPVTQALLPYTLALEVNAETTLALDGVEKISSNLCVYGLGKDEVFRLWRYSSLKYDDARKRVSWPTLWLATYQLFYCGSATVADALEVNATGDDLKTAATHFVCDMSAVAGIGQCWALVGKLFADESRVKTFKQTCQNAGGSSDASKCPGSERTGSCAYNNGTTMEYAYHYYKQNAPEAQTIDTLKSSCEATFGAKFLKGNTYVGTNESEQSAYSASQNGDPCKEARACYKANQGACTVYAGSYFAQNSQESSCTNGGGTWIAADGCPSTARLGCCTNLDNSSGAYTVNLAFYNVDGLTAASAANACTEARGTWILD